MSDRASRTAAGPRRRADGEATERRLLRVALDLFRKSGLERTTMRDVAAAAGLSLGAAYHYFPSKEAIVLAYYRATQREHSRRIGEELGQLSGLRERVRFVLAAKLEVLRRDRLLLSGLFRIAVDPTSPLSVFAAATTELRDESIASFAAAVDTPEVPAEARPLVAPLLWLAHLGLLLFFIHDTSSKQRRTWALLDDAADLLAALIPVAATPAGLALAARLTRHIHRSPIQ